MTTIDTGRQAGEILEACRRQVDGAHRAAIDALPRPIRTIAGYHLGWWSADGTPEATGGGKAIRPALAVLSGAAMGAAGDVAVPAAVAVELVHDFSLLHDDVMDHDLTRRHRATAWTVFGASPAILAGDAMLAGAMEVLAASDRPCAAAAVRLLGRAVQQLVEGQSADIAFEARGDVRLDECLAMAEGKTGALLGAACALGAMFGGARTDQVREFDRLGRALGVAFQLVDDLLGIWGDPGSTGKPVANDLRCAKKSLPVVAALTSGTDAGRDLATFYGPAMGESDVARAAELIEASGARAWCQDRADALTADALDRLAATALVPEPTGDLRVLARLMTRRDR
jgi:geranylgeranyl diphosphate synthase type I